MRKLITKAQAWVATRKNEETGADLRRVRAARALIALVAIAAVAASAGRSPTCTTAVVIRRLMSKGGLVVAVVFVLCWPTWAGPESTTSPQR